MFEKILALVLSVFPKVASLPKNAEGKSILTAEMKTTLQEKFGEKFVEQFEKDLAEAEKSDLNVTTSPTVVKLQQDLADMKSKFEAAQAENLTLKETNGKLEKVAEVDNSETIEMNKTGKKVAFKPNMAYMHNRVIEEYFNQGTMQYSGDDTIKTSELQDEFGKYVSGQKLDVFKSLNLGLTITDYMTTVVTDKSEWRAAHAIITSVLQQFTPKWTPKGVTEFTPITIKNFILKVNFPITPSDIIDKYIAYLYDETKTPDQMPIVAFVINELVLPQLLEDLELAMATGKFVERIKTTDGEAGSSALESMDGVLTILEAIKANPTNNATFLLDGVVLTSENILEEIDKAVDAVPYKYKKKKMLIHADPDLITLYRRAYRTKYPVTKNEDADKFRVDFSNLTFAPIDGLVGTGVFFITPKENFIHLMSRNVNDAKIFMQVQNYDVKVFMEFHKGTGFAMEEAIFAYIPPTGSGSVGGGL